jgi:O-antigen ligase
MNKLTSASLFFLAAGILTSVTVLSAYQILFTVAAFYYAFKAYKDKDLALPKSAYWLLAFFVVGLISTTLNVDIIPKPSKNFGRLKYFAYGIAGIYVFRYWLKETTDQTKKWIVHTFFASVIVAGVYAIGNYLIKDDPRARPLTETMRYGYGSGMFLLTLLSAILHKEKLAKFFNYKLAITAFVIGFLGMYLTYTRGALLGFLCGLPFVMYFYRPKIGLMLGGLAVLGVLGLGGMYLFGSGNYKSRFLVNKNNSSDVIRRSQWQAAIIAIKERPALGWGLSNFHTQLKRIKIEHDLDAKDYNDAHSHNLFLEIGSGTGLIGLALFLGWLLSWAWECFKVGGLTRALIIPFGVAFVVASQFEVTFDANNASMIFVVYALSAVFQNQKFDSLNVKQ